MANLRYNHEFNDFDKTGIQILKNRMNKLKKRIKKDNNKHVLKVCKEYYLSTMKFIKNYDSGIRSYKGKYEITLLKDLLKREIFIPVIQ